MTTHTFDDALNNVNGFQFPVGENEKHEIVYSDLKDISHLLVAGATGTGKSVFLNGLLLSLIHNNTPETLRLILFDSKLVEFSLYKDFPHLLIPIITDSRKLIGALQWTVFEIMKRLKCFSESGKQSIGAYNDYLWESFTNDTGLPRILIVIDDLALALSEYPEIEGSLQQIILKGRTVGVHLIVATQTPTSKSAKRISTSIRSKVLFSAATSAESKLLLGKKGAEALGEYGESLFSSNGGAPIKLFSFMPTPETVDFCVESAKKNPPNYDDSAINYIDGRKETSLHPTLNEELEDDELLPAAVDVILEVGQASVSMLQRRLKLGYSRAARLVDQMEERGIVGPFDGSKPRQLLITKQQWHELQMKSGSTEASASEQEIDGYGTISDVFECYHSLNDTTENNTDDQIEPSEIISEKQSLKEHHKKQRRLINALKSIFNQ